MIIKSEDGEEGREKREGWGEAEVGVEKNVEEEDGEEEKAEERKSQGEGRRTRGEKKHMNMYVAGFDSGGKCHKPRNMGST